MELKVLKTELAGLDNIDKVLVNFKDTWIKQIKKNSNQHFPFLWELNKGVKKEINDCLSSYQGVLNQLKYASFTQEKLSSLAHYLIELKITVLNDDKKKSRMIVGKFIQDDFLKLKSLVDEVKQFESDLENMKQVYNKVNKIVAPRLSLEHSLIFMDSSHKNHLDNLFLVCEKQKKLLKVLGQEFVSLTREMKKEKKL
jgi:hypothetical protein